MRFRGGSRFTFFVQVQLLEWTGQARESTAPPRKSSTSCPPSAPPAPVPPLPTRPASPPAPPAHAERGASVDGWGPRGGRRHPAPCVDCGSSSGPLSSRRWEGHHHRLRQGGTTHPGPHPHGHGHPPRDRHAVNSIQPRRRAGRTASASGRGQGRRRWAAATANRPRSGRWRHRGEGDGREDRRDDHRLHHPPRRDAD